MRKSPNIASRNCERCGRQYQPTGNTQVYCKECKDTVAKERKLAHYRKTHPDAKPKQKTTTPCCVCGGVFASHFDGKPYCNKHWLRMRNNGDTEARHRANTGTFTVEGDVLKITTASGEIILADAKDLELLRSYSWCISKKGYAVARVNGRVMKMHRLICGFDDPNQLVDHINRNKLDNRRVNLRACTNAENCRNATQPYNSKLIYTGVRKLKSGKYEARIMVDRKSIHVGTFATAEEAIAARKSAEDIYHGEFASHRGGPQ